MSASGVDCDRAFLQRQKELAVEFPYFFRKVSLLMPSVCEDADGILVSHQEAVADQQ